MRHRGFHCQSRRAWALRIGYNTIVTDAALLAAVLAYSALNAAAAAAFLWDKSAARRGARRVRERTLFTLIWIGGCIGAAIAMRLARHKTRRPAFMLACTGALALHASLWVFLFLRR